MILIRTDRCPLACGLYGPADARMLANHAVNAYHLLSLLSIHIPGVSARIITVSPRNPTHDRHSPSSGECSVETSRPKFRDFDRRVRRWAETRSRASARRQGPRANGVVLPPARMADDARP